MGGETTSPPFDKLKTNEKIQDIPMSEQRLADIETKIVFLEDQVEELNKTIYQQQQKMDRLEAICEALARQMRSLAETGNGKEATNERPPHY